MVNIKDFKVQSNSALSIPNTMVNEYYRDSILNSIKSSLSGRHRMVLVLGDSFSGKTTILKQFYETYQSSSAAYFVQADSYKDRANLIFADLCKQLLRFCTFKVTSKINETDLDEYGFSRIFDAFGRIYNDLCTQAKREGKEFYIILDALDKLSEDVLNEVLKLLPPGDFNGVYIIASLNSSSDIQLHRDYYPINIPYFSLAETQFILENLVRDKKLIEKIHKFCNGLPGYINELSINIKENPSVLESDFFSNLPESFEHYMESLWGQVSKLNEKASDILALLVFSPERLSKDDIRFTLNLEIESLDEILLKMEFIRDNDGTIYCPEIYLQFLKSKLEDKKSLITQLLIQFYEQQELTDTKTITFLSNLYVENNNYTKLRELMTLKTINLNLHQLNEASTVKKNLKILSQMSFKETDWSTYQKSILTNGIISEIVQTPPAVENEVKTLLSLKKYDEAIKLTYLCSLEDDRCFLLSLVCRSLKSDNQPIPNGILDNISNLIDNTEILADVSEELIDKLVSISTNLFPVDMQLALDIMKKIVENSSSNISKEKLMDYMLLKLFLKLGNKDVEYGDFQEITSIIDDTEIKDFLNVATTANIINFEQIIQQLQSINDSSAKMFYLINWCVNNENNKDLLKVVDYALNLFLETINHSLTIRDLRYLIYSIIDLEDVQGLDALLGEIIEISNSLISSPVQEYIKLELGIALIEKKLENQNAGSRFLDLCIYTSSITELDSKCLAYVYLLQRHCNLIGEADNDLYSELKDNLSANFNRLIIQSSDQDTVTSEIFFELSKIEYTLALIFVGKINTEKNRFKIFQQIIKGRIVTDNFSHDLIIQIYRNFKDKGYIDFLIFELCRDLAYNKNQITLDNANKILSCILGIHSIQTRIISLSFFLQISLQYSELHEEAYKKIEELLNDIEIYGDMKKIGYYVVQNISKYSLQNAEGIYSLIKFKETGSIISDTRLSNLHSGLISTLIKTLPEVIKNSDPVFYVRTINSNIERCNSIIDKAILLNELGLKLLTLNRKDLIYIFKQNYLEIFYRVWNDNATLNEIMMSGSSFLYFVDESLFLEKLDEIKYKEYKENSIVNVIKYLATKKSNDELIDLDNLALTIDHDTAKRIVELIENLTIDSNIFGALEIFTQVLEKSVKLREYTMREADISKFYKIVAKFIDQALPDNNNIKHLGYKIVCESLFARFRGVKLKNVNITRELPDFLELFKEAQKINNISDRIFVYCYLAEHAADVDLAYSTNRLNESEQLLQHIHNSFDKINRAEQIAKTYYQIGNAYAAENLLKFVFELARSKNKEDSSNSELEGIIELAHKINPELAQSLCKNIDSPHETLELNRTLQALNFHLNPSKIKDVKKVSNDSLNSFFVKTLRSLNAGRGSIQSSELIMESLSKIRIPTLENIFLGINWFIENNVLLNANFRDSFLNEQFDALTELLDFVYGLDSFIFKNEDLDGSLKNLYTLFTESNTTIYRPGEGDKAFNYIINWINENALESLVVYEPYFSPNEIDIFMKVHLKRNINIITSSAPVEKNTLISDYQQAWRSICDQAPPQMDFTILCSKNKKSPMHDRYLIGDSCSLKIGVSLNGFNKNDFSIEILDEKQTTAVSIGIIFPTLIKPPLEHEGQKIETYKFQL